MMSVYCCGTWGWAGSWGTWGLVNVLAVSNVLDHIVCSSFNLNIKNNNQINQWGCTIGTHPGLSNRDLITDILCSGCVFTDLSRLIDFFRSILRGKVASLNLLTLLLFLVLKLLQPLVLPHNQLLFSFRDHGADCLVVLSAFSSRNLPTYIIWHSLDKWKMINVFYILTFLKVF